jgi:hypothetical protein
LEVGGEGVEREKRVGGQGCYGEGEQRGGDRHR